MELLHLIKEGVNSICDAVKVALHSIDSELFFLLNFDDNVIFSDPHLIAALASIGPLPIEEKQKILRRILFGYIEDQKKPASITIFTGLDGEVYMPYIGYYQTPLINKEVTYQWKGSAEESFIIYDNVILDATFSPLIRVSDTDIEVCQSHDRCVRKHFREWEDDKLAKDSGVEIVIDSQKLRSQITPQIEEGFSILKRSNPKYANYIYQICRKIQVFENFKVRSFASSHVIGMAFFSYKERDDVIFILSEIIHQFGHNILYALIVDHSDYFNVDAYTPISKLNGNQHDHRTLFSAYHGLFTTAQTAVCLSNVIEMNIFEGKQKHELIGRFVDNRRRFRTGLERCSLNKILTQKGFELYKYLDEECCQVYQQKQHLVRQYDVADQPFVFDYSLFKAINPLQEKESSFL